MAAYVVFIREKTLDAAELATYAQKAPVAAAGHDLTRLALYGRQEVLEGPPIEGVVILQFPSLEAAKTWYHSPAYTDARQHRFKGADYRVVIVEGV